MAKYIDADKAIVEIEHHIRTGDELYPLSFGEKCINEGLGIATNVVDCMTPADVVERKRGTWIQVGYWSEGVGMGETYGNYFKCSVCEERVRNGYKHCYMNFCPNCGAKMDK